MRRTINSTGRQKIERGDFRFSLLGPEAGPKSFELTLDLDPEYDLPETARIFVEASRQATWMRFDCGTVGNFVLPPPEQRVLSELGSADGATFRIKVVENNPNADGPAARILAQADNVSAGETSSDGPSQSMLAIDWDETEGVRLGDEPWRLQIGENALLLVNKSMCQTAHWTALTCTDAFRAFAMPAIVRQILQHILNENADDPTSGPLGVWIKFANKTLGVGLPPDTEHDSGAIEREEWINRAVTAFCSRRGLRGAALNVMRPGGAA